MSAMETPLAALIRGQIVAGGPLRFSDYMALCLYHQQHGYYNSSNMQFGAAGDFITAPELGALFARSLARSIAPLAASFAGEYEIVEIGAGSGCLARDLLTALAAAGRAPTFYRIDEISPALHRRQAECLAVLPPDLLTRVRWGKQSAAPNLPRLILANEVLDALPFSRVRRSAGAWAELAVALAGESFVWCEMPPAQATWKRLQALEHTLGVDWDWPDDYLTEVHPDFAPALSAWTAGLICGAVYIIDYGYPRREFYLPERVMGTLLCHLRHHVHDDALHAPGTQDLTAFVDFTTVAEAADVLGLDVLVYTSQAEFLLASGILEELKVSAAGQSAMTEAAQARRLLLPGEMGEKFQVMVLGRGIDPALLPPAADWRHRL